MDPEQIWSTLSLDEKSALMRLYVASQSESLFVLLPQEIVQMIGSYFHRDAQSFHNLAQTCKTLRSKLGDYYLVADKSYIGPFVYRLANRVGATYGGQMKIATRLVFDEKCRYILVGDAKVDKVTGLILSHEADMPRGYITDPTPEVYFKGGGLVYVSDLKKKDPTYKQRRKEMDLHLKDTAVKLKSMKSWQKKKLFAAQWNETTIRRNKLLH